MISQPVIAPLGRLNFPRLNAPSNLIHCRWCGERLLKIKNAYLCEDCDAPEPEETNA